MRRSLLLAYVLLTALHAEVRTLSLKDAVDLALKQNPDLLLARFDEIKANQAVRLAKDPFYPKVGIGSGIAATYGFPYTIDGSAPAIIRVKATASIFNRQQSYRLAQERENARTTRIEFQGKRDDVVERVATAYLDADRSARLAEVAAKQIAALEQILAVTQQRVADGRAIRLDAMQAELDVQKAKERAILLENDARFNAQSLAMLLGFPSDDRIETLREQQPLYDLPATEDAAVKTALENSTDLKRLQSQILAKGYEIKATKASRLPRADLVADYGLFSDFNNFSDFFRRFQRNNAQLGVSFQLPLMAGPAANAQATQAEADSARLRTEVSNVRNRTSLSVRQAFQQVKNAERARDLARLDLDVQREHVSVLLAKLEGGRATQKDLEAARYAENEKWIAFYDAAYRIEKAKIALLKETGTLLVAMR
ncbi:MAG: TolC family protein [Bryobacteraceae bacterium]|nr:TolC family protein [Bryobacteraceae bacterium]